MFRHKALLPLGKTHSSVQMSPCSPWPCVRGFIQQGSRESGTWCVCGGGGGLGESRGPSVQEVSSGCPLAGSFLELGIWLGPQASRGKAETMPQTESMLYPLCPDDDPSGDPDYGEESQLEGSVATSFQCEVMQAPHSTSSVLPSPFLSKPNSNRGEAGLP